MIYSYEILPRPFELGGGWRLRLLEDGVEVGGGVFPPVEEYKDDQDALEAAFEDAERGANVWLDSKGALQTAFDNAESEAYAWLGSRDASGIDSQAFEQHRRQAAVDFALANVGLSGFTPSDEVQKQMRRFVDGEIKFDEFLKGVLDNAKRRRDGC